ncbi:MAG: helix-turn-helix transcriptional regulator [Rhodospirillales bacterium]|nr:helix-turn-helix transcriptional regulator [Alphaproteobacteria bacterium]MCB9977682.1 helix-turn-helix transcriptional regulator [Rhodospirillales bacterium]
MPTIEQIRAARALIGWSQGELAQQAGLSQTGIARIENGTNQPNSSTIEKITSAFDRADVEFIGETGVKKKTGEVRVYRGSEGFSFFLDDVYNTAVKFGTPEKPAQIYLSNVVHSNWVKWMGPEKWDNHVKRMIAARDLMDVRIIVREKDMFFPASAYSKYKWMPEEIFSDKSFYSYHDTLAFLNFRPDDVEIMIMRHKEFAQGYRNLFLIAWEKVAMTPTDMKN